jgi:hypothetical protein
MKGQPPLPTQWGEGQGEGGSREGPRASGRGEMKGQSPLPTQWGEGQGEGRW